MARCRLRGLAARAVKGGSLSLDNSDDLLLATGEIWQLNDSSAPTLLDRMRVAYNRADGGHVFGFKGLKTQAEESPYVIFNGNWPDVLDR